ncbi:hypothetical protein FOZ63_010585, partial [Perkinsus olseni]
EDIAAFAEATQGTVMLELYENMFHSFQQYSSLPQSQLALRRMARFVADAIRTPQKLPIGRSYSEGYWPSGRSFSIDFTGRSAEWVGFRLFLMSLRGLRILLEAWLRTIPFLTPEGTDIFRLPVYWAALRAFWRAGLRAWYLMMKHLVEAGAELALMAFTGETIMGEDGVTRLLRMPDEFSVESSSDGELYPSVMREIEAVGK